MVVCRNLPMPGSQTFLVLLTFFITKWSRKVAMSIGGFVWGTMDELVQCQLMDFYVSFKREKFTQNLQDTAGFSLTAPTDPFTKSLTESPVNLKEFLSIVCIFWWFEVFLMQQHFISSFDSRGKNMSIECHIPAKHYPLLNKMQCKQ